LDAQGLSAPFGSFAFPCVWIEAAAQRGHLAGKCGRPEVGVHPPHLGFGHDPDEALLGERFEPVIGVEEQDQGFVRAELGLHLPDRERGWAYQRGVIRELLGEASVDIGKARINGREALGQHPLRLGLALSRVHALAGDQQLVLRLPFAHQVLPLAHDTG
jgi:hypothetical protein